MDWDGQVAVVTGGSREIPTAEAEALRADIGAAGGRTALLQGDVADPAAVMDVLRGGSGGLVDKWAAALLMDTSDKMAILSGRASLYDSLATVFARREIGGGRCGGPKQSAAGA